MPKKLKRKTTPKPKRMTLVIPRSIWLRGEGADRSSLLRKSDGKMCCLGILGKACRVPRKIMLNEPSPAMNMVNHKNWPAWLFSRVDFGPQVPSRDCWKLFRANDSEKLSEKVREDRVARIMKRNGVDVRFTK